MVDSLYNPRLCNQALITSQTTTQITREIIITFSEEIAMYRISRRHLHPLFMIMLIMGTAITMGNIEAVLPRGKTYFNRQQNISLVIQAVVMLRQRTVQLRRNISLMTTVKLKPV